jgi:hypothetical protein
MIFQENMEVNVYGSTLVFAYINWEKSWNPVMPASSSAEIQAINLTNRNKF